MHKHASANRFYRLVWSTVHRCWVAVAEGTRSHGKGGARRRAAAVLAGSLAAGAAAAAGAPPSNALPSGMQLVAGQAGVNVQGSQMTVSQATQQAILNWQHFDIGADAQVRFNQPNAAAVALNRVVGGEASAIFGKLSSNGKVFLVNPQGVLFGASAQVDVGGLVASSLGMSDQDFLAGSYRFSGAGAGAVRNEGRISADGGVVALLAPAVSNSGSISARGGSVALAAGNAVGLDFRGDGLITVRVEQGALDALAENKGLLQADGGQVLLTAKAADALARSTVNNAGLVQARGLVTDGGAIRLVGDGLVQAGQLDASSAKGKGGSVSVTGGFVSLDGTVRADGVRGGSISATAAGDLSAASALSASGTAGRGGEITLHSGASLVENSSASASVAGATDGGAMSLQAGGSLLSSGRHDAHGLAGQGGRVDISGADVRLLGASVDASGAAQGGLVRVGGAFQGGAQRDDAPDADRFTGRWGATAGIANSEATFVNDSTVLDVSARGAAGQGGTAIVWSQKQTTMMGAVKATGTARGGAVEVSAHEELRHVGLEKIQIGAGGRLLLDPKDIVIGDFTNQWTYDAIIGKGFSGGKNVDVSGLKDGEGFGYSVALTSDGKGMAVGAPYNEGVGLAADTNYGAVRLFRFSDGQFGGGTLVGTIGRGYTGGNNLDMTAQLSGQDMFGSSVALNNDGKVMAVGALAGMTGKVYAFSFGDGFATPALTQTIASQNGTSNGFGASVALNGAGDQLAVGAMLGNSVELYAKPSGSFGYTSTIVGGNSSDSQFGTAVALNDAGTQLAVGAPGEDSGRGAVYLYKNPFGSSSYLGKMGQGGSVLNVSLNEGELFGSSLAINDAGTRLAVGAPGNGGLGNTGPGPGAVRVFDYTGNFSGMNMTAVVGRDYTQGANASLDIDDFGNFGFALAMNGAGDALVVAQPFDNSFDGSTVASGTVSMYRLLPAPNAGNVLFNQIYPKSSVNASVDAQKLAQALTNGTSITLQANNDITWQAGNAISSIGSGDLSLQAGRSVALNSNIDIGGNLNVLANAGVANGVVSAYRNAGQATINMASGTTINAKNVNLTIGTGAGQAYSSSGDIAIGGVVNANTVKVINQGPSAGSDVVINLGGKLAGSGGGGAPAVVVAAAGAGGGTFTNNAGASGLQGVYNVYSDTPQNTLEGLTGYSKYYGTSYDPQGAGYNGNRFFYTVKPTLNVSVQNASKTYDGTGALPTPTYTATGYIDGDSGSIIGSPTATGFTKNVGVYSWAKGGLDSSLGYNINFVSGGTLTVTKRALTVTATGIDKVYDGLTTASVNVGDNRIAGDTLTINRSAAFSNKNAGNGKAVNVSGISISGADSGNYSLSNTTAATTANITQRTLNVGATASNKVYDGGTFASVSLNDNRVGGDSLVVSMGGTSFADKNVGTAKNVQVTGLALSGTDAGNYALASTTASTTANITKRQLTVGLNASDKVYDGALGASVSYADDRVMFDVLSVSGSAAFADKNAGNGKTVTATGLSLSGTDAGNYSLASSTATGTAAITQRGLNVTATGNNKVYDGTRTATVSFGDDRVAGDVLGISGNASFADKNAGNGKAISVSGITLSGTDAGNYALVGNTAATSADISQRVLTVTTSGGNKTYDGTTGATVVLNDNRVGGDSLSLASGGSVFVDKNAGSGKTVNTSGISISGADAANYSLASTSATSTADIAARSLTVTASGIDRVYDGGTVASVNFGDNRVAGDVLGISGSATFADKNAGNGKAVSVSGIALSGTDAGNYALSATTAGTTANISQRTLNVSASAANKVYDGGVVASATLGDDRVSGDTLVVNQGAAAFADKNAGNGKNVLVTGLSLSGADAGNYALGSTSASATANITQRQLTVGVNASDKVYDGGMAASVAYTDNRVNGDVLGVSGAASFSDKNVGNGKTVTANGLSLSGTDAGNYALASTTATGTAAITPRALVVTATGNNKVYDGTTAATVNFVDDRVAGDVLGVSGNAAFVDKNAGSGKTVNTSGISISGADAGNYSLASTSATSTADIVARSLTVTASGIDRVYDGGTVASVNFGDNRVAGDVLGISGSATFADKNAGNGKAVSVSGIALSGTDAGNYALTATTAGTTANISQRTLNVSAAAANKVYDGGVVASATLGDDRVSGDTLVVNQGAAVFSDKNAGNGKNVLVTGLSLSGADAGNYALGSTSASATANITQRQLTVGVNASDKVYDGGVAASVAYTDNRVNGDVLGVSGAASFSDKNVGNGKTVTANGLSLSGTDAGNYALVSTTATGTAAITPRALVVTTTGNNKVYDGTTAATVNFGDDRVAGDVLGINGNAAFVDKNAGSGKAVNTSGISISGADAGNYSLASTSATSTADIMARSLTVTASGIDRVYDGGTVASVSFSDNRVAGDVLGVSGSAAFADKNAGNGKAVSVSGIALSGADAGNYALTATTAGTTANISQRTLNVSAAAANKVYDGGVVASATLGDDRVSGDTLVVNQGAAAFADKNAGNGKNVLVTGLSLSGADAGNYALGSTSASATANITQRQLTVGVNASDKVYDGGVAASVAYTDNRVNGDVLGVSGAASFSDKNVGNGKTVTANGLALSGTDAGNYALASNSATGTAAITPRALVVTATGNNKVYDGTTAATVNFGDDRVAGDVLAVSGNAAFVDKNAGSGKAVNTSGISISGADAGNYSLASTSATSTADITARSLIVTASGNNKVYDGTVAASVNFGDNRVAGDVLTVSGSAAFADKNAASGKSVAVAGISLSGADANNYSIVSTSAASVADITARSLTVTASGNNKVYDGTTAATANFSDNRVAGDSLAVSGIAAFGDKNAGSGKTVNVTSIALSGADAGNYALSATTAGTTANIAQRTLNVNASAANKVYDGNVAASVTLGDDRVGGDSLALALGGAVFADKNVGAGKTVSVSGITVAGPDAANYQLSSSTAKTTGSITPRALTANVAAADKVYDGTNGASVILVSDDRVAGDQLHLAGGVGSFSDKNAGIGKAVVLSGVDVGGADAGNYAISIVAKPTANISPRALDVSAAGIDKVYDGSQGANVTFSDNRLVGDSLQVAGNASFTDRNAGKDKSIAVSGLALSGADAANYALASTTVGAKASIARKALQVKADDQLREFGGSNPALTWRASGFVGGDTEALLDGVQTSTGARRESPAGFYAINIDGNSPANYAVSYVNGVMTVQRAPQEFENAIGNAVNPPMPAQPVTPGQGGSIGLHLANNGGNLVPMPAPIATIVGDDGKASIGGAADPVVTVAPGLLAVVPAGTAGQQPAAVRSPAPVAAAPALLPVGEVREMTIGGGSRVMVRDGGVNAAGAPN